MVLDRAFRILPVKAKLQEGRRLLKQKNQTTKYRLVGSKERLLDRDIFRGLSTPVTAMCTRRFVVKYKYKLSGRTWNVHPEKTKGVKK